MSLPSEPITRKEQYLAKAAGQAVEIPAEPITREEAYLDAIAKGSGGGGGGTSDYSQLTNKPQINGNTLTGNKTASQLGLASTADLARKVDKVEGYGLSENDYTDADAAIVAGVTTALAGKQDTLTFDSVPTDGSTNPVESNGVYDALATKADASAVKKEYGGTLAGWNALTTEEKKEYDAYDITDDYSDGNYIYLPTIYSEEERQVGVYADGKPLYQKTYRNVQCGNNARVTIDANFGSDKEVKGFSAVGHFSDSTNYNFVPLQSYSSTSDKCYPQVVNGLLVLEIRDNWSAWTCDITVQYTKTTDTAGSGTWTPTGQYAEHYSTDEQIVGTWIDGSTLWEKMIDFGALPNTSSKQVATGLTNVKVRKIDANSRRSSDGFAISIPHATTGGVQYQVSVNYSNGNIDISAGTDMTAFDETYITLQYTKTA